VTSHTADEYMATICTRCSRDPDLVSLIEEAGTVIAQCSVCKSRGVVALDAEDQQLIATIRALIRKYFNEWEYNTHWGGDGLEALFQRENPILNYDAGWLPIDIEEATLPAVEEGYETATMPISLFAGYYNGEQNMLLESLIHGDEERFHELLRRTRRENPYLIEPEVKSLLEPHLSLLRRQIPAGIVVHRARIGFAERNYQVFERPEDAWFYLPYEGRALGAAPPVAAASGRMNRAGVSFLYAASNQETALSEVRPHPGHVVSVGEFRSSRDLVVADFNQVSIRNFSSSDERLVDYWFLLSIDRLFSVPVPPEERQSYVLSQLFSDVIRQLGFDGIAFHSSIGIGLNYAFFDASGFDYVADSAQVLQVASLNYVNRPLKKLVQTADDGPIPTR
jgi:hypothetical protein